jgi:hypothetical protein
MTTVNVGGTEYTRAAIVSRMCADMLGTVIDRMVWFEIPTDEAVEKLVIVQRALAHLAEMEGPVDV